MTDRPEDHPEQRPDDVQLGRRLFIFKAAALLGIASLTAATTVASTTTAEAQYTGRTDRDPYDRSGRGIRRVRRYRSGITDRDPYDRAGRGIRYRRRRRTDRDPYDRAGRGIR